MKKLLIATIILLFSALVLTACGNRAEDPPEATNGQENGDANGQYETYDTGPEDEIPIETRLGNPVRGVWEEDMFISQYLNLRFVKPDGWEAVSDQEISEWFGTEVDSFAEFEAGLLDDAEEVLLVDMLTIDPFTGIFVHIEYEPLVFPFTRLSEAEYIQRIINYNALERVETVPGNFRIGDYYWYAFRSYSDLGMGINAVSHSLVNILDGVVRMIVVTYVDTVDPITMMLASFSSLQDPVPPPVPLPTPPPAPEPLDENFFGTWVWEWDQHYVNEFRPDGTGRRGWYPDVQEFHWFTIAADNYLMLHFGLSRESWTYSFADDMVTLDSRINIGETSSYVRWEGAFLAPEPVDFTGHPLIGTWIWDVDETYIFIFHEDGSGIRGFYPDQYEIQWFVHEEYLFIEAPMFVGENWVFAIEGDVLTINSVDMYGVVWSYVRQQP